MGGSYKLGPVWVDLEDSTPVKKKHIVYQRGYIL